MKRNKTEKNLYDAVQDAYIAGARISKQSSMIINEKIINKKGYITADDLRNDRRFETLLCNCGELQNSMRIIREAIIDEIGTLAVKEPFFSYLKKGKYC
jgi:hypothetical protein